MYHHKIKNIVIMHYIFLKLQNFNWRSH